LCPPEPPPKIVLTKSWTCVHSQWFCSETSFYLSICIICTKCINITCSQQSALLIITVPCFTVLPIVWVAGPELSTRKEGSECAPNLKVYRNTYEYVIRLILTFSSSSTLHQWAFVVVRLYYMIAVTWVLICSYDPFLVWNEQSGA